MRRSRPRRAGLLLALLALGAGATSCGTGDANNPFYHFQRILLDSLHRGSGTLQPGGRPLLLGPFPTISADDAAAARLQLECLSGPGLVQARLWFSESPDLLRPAADVFGFSRGAVDLEIGASPLDTIVGSFRSDAFSRLYLEVALAAGQPATEVRLTVTPLTTPAATTLDLEPNNGADQAAHIEPKSDGSPLTAAGVMNPLFGDDFDWYHILPPSTGTLGLTMTTNSPAGADTTVEVFDDDGTTILESASGPTVDVVPMLGNLPAVGRLFRTRVTDPAQRDNLVILIRPRIVINE